MTQGAHQKLNLTVKKKVERNVIIFFSFVTFQSSKFDDSRKNHGISRAYLPLTDLRGKHLFGSTKCSKIREEKTIAVV